MFNNQINSIINSVIEMKGLDLLDNWLSVRSLSTTDQFSSDKIYQFWMNSQNIQESQISDSKKFLDEFLKLSSDNILLLSEMLDLIVEYYMIAYDNLEFKKPLILSLRHIKSSYILAKFIISDGIIDYYLR